MTWVAVDTLSSTSSSPFFDADRGCATLQLSR